jgi:hypothetical protein
MMEDSISAVLSRLARNGVSVRWAAGKALFSAPTEPPADVVALIDARKVEISTFLHPDAVQRRLDAEADLLQAPRPPDVGDGQWETAMRGLRAFLANGHGAEAEALGWPRSELYRVPELWSQIHLTGAALLLGDGVVTEVAATRIKFRTASGAPQAFDRKPELDLVLAYRSNYAALRRDLKHEDAEPAAYDRVVALCQSTGLDLETSKQRAMAAMKESLRR